MEQGGSLGEQIGTLGGSVMNLAGSAGYSPFPIPEMLGSSVPVMGSAGQFITGSLGTTLSAGPETQGSVNDAMADGSLTDILMDAGSLEEGVPLPIPGVELPPIPVPVGSLAILADLMGAGSVADATNSELGALSGSLGVAEGSLTGLLPVLALAGSIAGGVALAGGVQLPPIALPPLPAGSSLPAPLAAALGQEQAPA